MSELHGHIFPSFCSSSLYMYSCVSDPHTLKLFKVLDGVFFLKTLFVINMKMQRGNIDLE